MNLGDLSFEIKQGVVDGELNINPSGILSGRTDAFFYKNSQNNKSMVKVTAKDGQTKDIEITWELDTLKFKVSGFDGYYDTNSLGEEYVLAGVDGIYYEVTPEMFIVSLIQVMVSTLTERTI